MPKKVSILVPTYNEEENVGPISQAIIAQMDALPEYDYEIVFIDNCSQDNTRPLIRKLCSDNPKIKAIFNAKNYGQFNSPFYGITQMTGDCAISMSADFQDPPELIPQFISAWEDGYKLVMGQKTTSKEGRLLYRVRTFYYRYMKKHSNIDFLQQVTGFGLYDRSFINIMRNLDDPSPFLRGIVSEMGYDIKLIPFEQPQRRAGKSSNNFFSYYDAAIQSLVAYSKVGVRLTIGFGIVMTIISTISIIGLGIYKMLNWDNFSVTPYGLDLFILLAVSLNIFFLGFIGEYVLDIKQQVRKRPLVIEAERINFDEQ